MVFKYGLSGVWFGTFTGNGGGTTYNIPHGMDPAPNFAIITPVSSDAASQLWYVSQITSTNIVLVYKAATTGSTDAIVVNWMAGNKFSVRDEIRAYTGDIDDDDAPDNS